MPIVRVGAGFEISLVRAGPRGGAPILLLHALGFDLTYWGRQMADLGSDHDVVAIDLPGHGLSPRAGDVPSFEVMAGAVAAVVDHLGAGSAHLVGISFGGMVAQTAAVARPDTVRSLTLVATSCTFPDDVRQTLTARACSVREGKMGGIVPLHLDRWFPRPFRAARPDLMDRIARTLLPQDPEFHAALWDVVATLDIGQRLPAIACQALVVAGSMDPSASPAAGQAIVDRLARAELRVIGDCGHFPPLETPEAFNALLRRFVDKAGGEVRV